MRWYRKAFKVCFAELWKCGRDYKSALIIMIVFAFFLSYMKGFYDYLSEIQMKASAWQLPFWLYGWNARLVIYGSAVLLFSTLLKREHFRIYEIARCGKQSYVAGKILFVAIGSFLLIVMIHVVAYLPYIRYLRITDDWGNIYGSWIQKHTQYSSGFMTNMRFLRNESAVMLNAYCAIQLLLGYMLIGYSFLLAQLLGLHTAGILFNVGLIGMDQLVKSRFLGPDFSRTLSLFSPLSWSNPEYILFPGEVQEYIVCTSYSAILIMLILNGLAIVAIGLVTHNKRTRWYL